MPRYDPQSGRWRDDRGHFIKAPRLEPPEITPVGPRWIPRAVEGPAPAFDLRDQGFDMTAFEGRDDIAVNVIITRYIDGEAYEQTRTVFFDYGEDEDEAWQNYHEAIRETIDDTWEGFDEDFPDSGIDDEDDYESTAVGVSAIG